MRDCGTDALPQHTVTATGTVREEGEDERNRLPLEVKRPEIWHSEYEVVCLVGCDLVSTPGAAVTTRSVVGADCDCCPLPTLELSCVPNSHWLPGLHGLVSTVISAHMVPPFV